MDFPVTLRVRPVRVVVLINSAADSEDLIRVMRFLSQLWGGRFSLILPVAENTPDALTKFRLGYWRPDCVYGMGIALEQWGSLVNEACQPRQFCLLDPEVAEDIHKAAQAGFIHGDHAIHAMFKARHGRSRFDRPLTVVSADRTASLAPFCAAMFGVHPPGLREDRRDETREADPDDVVAFVDLCTEFCENNWQTWLDANAFGLSSYQNQTPSPEPTVVLVGDSVSDLSHFWNLRSIGDPDEAPRILPVLHGQSGNTQLVEAVARWLGRFDKVSNYCVVTSSTVSGAECTTFCDTLKQALSETSIEYIDYETPRNRVHRVIPFESEVTWSVKRDDQKIEFVPPKPEVLPTLNQSDCWYVDLVHEAGSHRSIGEMQLPSSTVIPEILNGPCPPNFEHAVMNRFGDGVDTINARCSSSKDIIRFYVPKPDEVIEELIREAGYEPVRDEKRSSYIPTVERLGGLLGAATALSGISGEIIQAISEGTELPNQIRGVCKLGGGDLAIDDYLGRVDSVNLRRSERTKRLVRRRFAEHARGEIPERLTLSSFLEHWTDRSVLVRRWKIGPCGRCGQSWFAHNLSLQEPIDCPNCGSRVLLSERVPIGYSLSPPVKHSLDEGIVPVVLAGRFLRNLTSRGFFWLPGVKYTKDGQRGDADIVACCDGHLVFAECKTLVDTPSDAAVWTKVVDQFLELANLAIACGGDLVVLAAQVDNYPDEVVQRIEDVLKDQISYILLDASDLASGHRKLEGGRWLSMSDLLPEEFPESPRVREGGPREMNFGYMKFTKGG